MSSSLPGNEGSKRLGSAQKDLLAPKQTVLEPVLLTRRRTGSPKQLLVHAMLGQQPDGPCKSPLNNLVAGDRGAELSHFTPSLTETSDM